MRPVEAGPQRPRWGTTVACVVVSWVVAGAFAVIASLSGSQFAAGPAPDPSGSVLFWGLAGVFIAIPVAAMPSLGFRVRRAVARTTAAAVVIAVTLIGVFVLNTP